MPIAVKDIHGQIYPTRVRRIVRPRTTDAIRPYLREAAQQNLAVCQAGGRHAMGGQQFATDGVLIDTRRLNKVLDFDPGRGTIMLQGGIQWPRLVEWLLREQSSRHRQGLPTWGIAQKQTGADDMTLAGSLSSNTHGRGLTMKPLVGDILSFVLMDADGQLHRCSRDENRERFSLGIGGYGMLGIVTEITLQLAPRHQVERVVRVIDVYTPACRLSGGLS